MRSPLGLLGRKLLHTSTDAERLLWRYLKNKQQLCVKFRRQEEIENYIVDFVFYEKKVIVELDGSQHADNAKYDKERDRCLQGNGYVVLRFWNNEVLNNTEGVLEVIRQHLL